jgi:transcriptional regulator with XRE-family HTH domain
MSINLLLSEGLYPQILMTIKIVRKQQKLSQVALAKKLGMVQRHISDIERGKTIPRFDTLLDILRVLNFDLVLTPKNLLPLIHAMINDAGEKSPQEKPLYAVDDDE